MYSLSVSILRLVAAEGSEPRFMKEEEEEEESSEEEEEELTPEEQGKLLFFFLFKPVTSTPSVIRFQCNF